MLEAGADANLAGFIPRCLDLVSRDRQPVRTDEALPKGVERAGADVAKDDAECAQCEACVRGGGD